MDLKAGGADQPPVPTGAGGITIRDAREWATARLSATEATASSRDRFDEIWRRFELFALNTRQVAVISEVDAELARDFVEARTKEGGRPSPATMRLRRSAIRLLFRVLRASGLTTSDPTLDLLLPNRELTGVRALTDEEVEACRWSSVTARSGERGAAWACMEAGAATSELAFVEMSDLDPGGHRLRLRGGFGVEPRWVPLEGWAEQQLRSRFNLLGPTGRLLARSSLGKSRRNPGTQVIRDLMTRAGVPTTPDVASRSVSAWLGQRILRETHRIELVAVRLGYRSLDRAAELVGFEWRPEPTGES